MTEKSAASDACLPSFPTIPTPKIHCQTRSRKKGKDIKLTNISSLDHTNVISPITDTTYTFLGMFPDKSSNISFLGRRTPARDHCRELCSDLDKLVRKQIQTELDGPISVTSSGYKSNPDLKRLSINDKTAIQLRL